MEEAEHFMAGAEFQVNSDKVLELVHDSGCSAYDCEFVALAKDVYLPLITNDKQTIKEFPEVALSVNQFLIQ
jgi:predicted nucleic acid-binding protein